MLTLFHGDKGGVGKSVACMVYADYKLFNGELPIIIDGDTRNHDVYDMFSNDCSLTYNLGLRKNKDWYKISELVEKNPDKEIIVSLPGGVEELDMSYLEEEVQLYGVPLKIFFLMQNHYYSIEFLDEMLQKLNDLNSLVIVLNTYFDDANSYYELIKESKIYKKIQNNNIPIVEFPSILNLVLRNTLKYKQPFHKIEFETIRDKIRIYQWLDNSRNALILEPSSQKNED